MNIDLSPLWQWIQDQLTLASLYMQRPAVQRQVAAIVIVLAVTWLAPRLLDMLLVRFERRLHARHQRNAVNENTAAEITGGQLPPAADDADEVDAEGAPARPQTEGEATGKRVAVVTSIERHTRNAAAETAGALATLR